MKLIDKEKVVAEIERRISNHNKELKYASDEDFVSSWASDEENQKLALTALIPFINTLEVKEVDLEKSISDWLFEGLPNDEEEIDYIKETARHFFELGLKVQKDSELTQKDISIIYGLVIDAVYEQMRCKNPSFEGKDIYQEVLKRFKAQKGE